MKNTLFFSLIMFFLGCGPAPTTAKTSPAITQEVWSTKSIPHKPESVKAPAKKYLSLDGGAMMGIIPLIILSDIEAKLGKPIYELVDGVIGTSTGAIIGALLVTPGKDGKPFSAQEILQFYYGAKEGVFSDKNLKSSFLPPKSTKHAKKMTAELASALLNVFRSEKLSNALIPLKIASYDVNESKIYIFDSLKAQANPSHDLYVRDAVLASTSISEFFTKALITLNNSQHTFVDLADINVPRAKRTIDPSHLLYRSLETFQPDETAIIYSLGTGITTGPSRKTRELMGKSSKIKIVRFDPNISEYLAECKAQITFFGKPLIKDSVLRSLIAGGPMNLSLLMRGPKITNSLRAFEDAAEKLKSSEKYQQMLDDLKK